MQGLVIKDVMAQIPPLSSLHRFFRRSEPAFDASGDARSRSELLAGVRPKMHRSPCFAGRAGHEWRPKMSPEEESEAVLGGGNDLEECKTAS